MTISGDYLFLTIGLICALLSCFASMSIAMSMRVGAMFAWIAFVVTGLSLTGTTGSVRGVIIGLSVAMITMHAAQFFNTSRGKKGKN